MCLWEKLIIFIFYYSNEEVYLFNDSSIAVDRVMQKCGELIKSKPQTVMETIAQYRYVCVENILDLCDYRCTS